MIALPPSTSGAVNATVTWALPAVAMPMVGAPGALAGVTLFEGSEGALEPTPLLATTVQDTATPFVRPVTAIGEFAPVAVRVPQVAV